MIAPGAIDFDQAAKDALAGESKRTNKCDRAIVVGNDVRSDPMKPALFKRVIDECGHRIAHQSLSRFTRRQPVPDMTVKARPLADATEACNSNDAAVVARADKKA